MKDGMILRNCDICGVTFIQDYGYSLAGMWAVTGFHEGVPGYQCEHGQSWGCTPEHAKEAFLRCLEDDACLGISGLRKKHEEAKVAGMKEVEPELLWRKIQKGEKFHIIDKDELPSIVESYRR